MEEKGINMLKVIIFIFGLCISFILFSETSYFGAGFISGYYIHNHRDIESNNIDLITLNNSLSIVGYENTTILYGNEVVDNSVYHREVLGSNITDLHLYNFDNNDSISAYSTFTGNTHGVYNRGIVAEMYIRNTTSFFEFQMYAIEDFTKPNNTDFNTNYNLGFKVCIYNRTYLLIDGYGVEHELGNVNSENIVIQHVPFDYRNQTDLRNTTIRIYEDGGKIVDYEFAYNASIEDDFPIMSYFCYKGVYSNQYLDNCGNFGILGFQCNEFDGYEDYYNLTTADLVFREKEFDYTDRTSWSFNLPAVPYNISIVINNNTEYNYFQINIDSDKYYNSSTITGIGIYNLSIVSYSNYDFYLMIYVVIYEEFDSEAPEFALTAFYPVILCCVVVYISIFPMIDKLKDFKG